MTPPDPSNDPVRVALRSKLRSAFNDGAGALKKDLTDPTAFAQLQTVEDDAWGSAEDLMVESLNGAPHVETIAAVAKAHRQNARERAKESASAGGKGRNLLTALETLLADPSNAGIATALGDSIARVKAALREISESETALNKIVARAKRNRMWLALAQTFVAIAITVVAFGLLEKLACNVLRAVGMTTTESQCDIVGFVVATLLFFVETRWFGPRLEHWFARRESGLAWPLPFSYFSTRVRRQYAVAIIKEQFGRARAYAGLIDRLNNLPNLLAETIRDIRKLKESFDDEV